MRSRGGKRPAGGTTEASMKQPTIGKPCVVGAMSPDANCAGWALECSVWRPSTFYYTGLHTDGCSPATDCGCGPHAAWLREAGIIHIRTCVSEGAQSANTITSMPRHNKHLTITCVKRERHYIQDSPRKPTGQHVVAERETITFITRHRTQTLQLLL